MSPASIVLPKIAVVPTESVSVVPATTEASAATALFAALMGQIVSDQAATAEAEIIPQPLVLPVVKETDLPLDLAVAMLAALTFMPPPAVVVPVEGQVAEPTAPVMVTPDVPASQLMPIAPAAEKLPPGFAPVPPQPVVVAEPAALPATATVAPVKPSEPPPPVEAIPVGTASAKQSEQMKMNENVEVNARRAEKNLPRGQVLPEVTERVSAAVAIAVERPTQVTLAPETNALLVATPVADRPAQLAETAPVAVARSAEVDKIFAAVMERVVTFKRVGLESLDVNLKPDRNTEISLQLSIHHGQVEVIARLERGHLETLQANWQDLQQTLAQQGVRLGRLVPSAELGNDFSQTMSGGFGRPADRQSSAAPETFAAVQPLPARSRAAAGTRRGQGWEMWA